MGRTVANPFACLKLWVIVPGYIATVQVRGAVVNPTSVLDQENAGVDFCMADAGVYMRNADQGWGSGAPTAMRACGTHFCSSAGIPRLSPGVPAKPEAEPPRVTKFLGTVVQILASTVATVAIATR